jgi:hypothetical protein
MRTDGQIRHKLKQLIFRHRKKFVEKGLSQKPHNCKHNGVVRLPVHTGNRATIHVCTWGVGHVVEPGKGHDGENWNNRVCDSSMGGDEQAQECPYYEGCHSPESLKAEFTRKLGFGDNQTSSGQLAQEYPDLIALMWVLGTAKKKNGADNSMPEGDGILAFFGSDVEEPDEVPDEPLLEEADE